jgi:acyl-CoA synthetase (AMP-forming)/AMP-acid ligase II
VNIYPAECRDKLAGYELPRRAVFTDAFHHNPTGKARKRVLREQFPLDASEQPRSRP